VSPTALGNMPQVLQGPAGADGALGATDQTVSFSQTRWSVVMSVGQPEEGAAEKLPHAQGERQEAHGQESIHSS
jgi:hypothetical protein